MSKLYLRLFTGRRVVILAAVANLVHPLVHGTPLDAGALDQCLLAVSAAALCEVGA